jgi:hypothetical protein
LNFAAIETTVRLLPLRQSAPRSKVIQNPSDPQLRSTGMEREGPLLPRGQGCAGLLFNAVLTHPDAITLKRSNPLLIGCRSTRIENRFRRDGILCAALALPWLSVVSQSGRAGAARGRYVAVLSNVTLTPGVDTGTTPQLVTLFDPRSMPTRSTFLRPLSARNPQKLLLAGAHQCAIFR